MQLFVHSYAAADETSCPAVTVADLSAAMNEINGRKLIDKLQSPDCSRWNDVMDAIKSGDTQWVVFAGKLRPFTDAGTATDLLLALEFALLRNPEAVLRLTQSPAFENSEFCVTPLWEASSKQVLAFIEEALTALETVKSPELQKVRRECEARYRSIQARLKIKN